MLCDLSMCLEVIIINDGSKDSSGSICASFEQRFKNIKVIYQKNQGLSAARNRGLDEAHGEYIMFVDSDDWLETNYFDIFLEEKKYNTDVIVFGYQNDTINNTRILLLKDQIFEQDRIGNAVIYLDNAGYFFNLAWNKIYKRDVIKDIRFDSDAIYVEDLLFNIKVFKHVKSVKMSSKMFYHYRSSENSLTNNRFYSNYKELADKAIFARTSFYHDLGIENEANSILIKKNIEYRLGEITNLYRANSTHCRWQRINVLKTIKCELKEKNSISLIDGKVERLVYRIVCKFDSSTADFILSFLFHLKMRFSLFYYKFM